MSTARDRMMSLLRSAPLCDDCVAERLRFKQRQQANMLGRELERGQRVRRERARCGGCGTHKLVNHGSTAQQAAPAPLSPAQPASAPQASAAVTLRGAINGQVVDRPWSWEGSVQARIVEHLQGSGWVIERAANTASRETGKDIVARLDARRLWISVKGYPEKSPHVQARHWFAGALFDLLVYRSEDPDVELAIGLPDGFSTYRNMLPRVAWAKKQLPFKVFFVAESGRVREE